jgi:glycerol uptake facilitator-like aquaporin
MRAFRTFLLIFLGTFAVLNAACVGFDVYTDAWFWAACNGAAAVADAAMFLWVKSDS